jgi:hypothetical protein
MSQRLADRFAACRDAKRTAFVGFVTAGYPKLDSTVPALLEMEKNGCDVIELGVPFSDPMADGSVIEAASVVAIKNGIVYDDVLAYTKEALSYGSTLAAMRPFCLGAVDHGISPGVRMVALSMCRWKSARQPSTNRPPEPQCRRQQVHRLSESLSPGWYTQLCDVFAPSVKMQLQ